MGCVSLPQSYLYCQQVSIYMDYATIGAVLQNPSASGKYAQWWAKFCGGGMKEDDIMYRAEGE